MSRKSKTWLTLADVAKITGLPMSRVQAMLLSGELPAPDLVRRTEHHVRRAWLASTIERWLKTRRKAK